MNSLEKPKAKPLEHMLKVDNIIPLWRVVICNYNNRVYVLHKFFHIDIYQLLVLNLKQTGSGKTFTIWGPPSAMVEDPSPSSNQGLAPRIFHLLFSEIQKVGIHFLFI